MYYYTTILLDLVEPGTCDDRDVPVAGESGRRVERVGAAGADEGHHVVFVIEIGRNTYIRNADGSCVVKFKMY